ncbi:forespore capture DNA-binding protein RefZ [Siminovitchia sp. 179-K 8D1 HS]|uniref:forespore capture DNA-binding protein RefZ n=1 Tax=Siminovitchia sp. 179-K 8D1 HS TaxID=3142385 RepID=UPI0039A08D42
MSVSVNNTKELIFEAAIELFHAKGFKGTTIRDIAAKAKVNPANISYYFQGKQGLLEACLIRFFESYVLCLEEEAKKLEWEEPEICLNRAVRKILYYQSECHLLTRLVWREITIDSQVSREIISSYLMKERYYLKLLASAALKEKKTVLPLSMFIIQLKGMLAMPYLNSQYISEVWGIQLQDPYFIEKYYGFIKDWVSATIGSRQDSAYLEQIQPAALKSV